MNIYFDVSPAVLLCHLILEQTLSPGLTKATISSSFHPTPVQQTIATMAFQPWRALPGKGVLLLLNVLSSVALIYEGYNQGVYGSVSGTPASSLCPESVTTAP